jgi:hypothetical protein
MEDMAAMTKKKVQAPPSDLAQACNVSSVDSTTACEAACEASRCCFDADSITNCYSYSDNYSACDAYRQSCSFLGPQFGDNPIYFKDPPSNLANVCSFDEVAQNKGSCELACGSVSCCFGDGPDETGPCFEELKESCAKYAPCGILTSDGGSGGQVDMASPDLTSACQEANVASAMRGECERLCRPASCCWSQHGPGQNCVAGNEEICKSYHLCDNLNLIPPRPALDLNLFCETADIVECESACDQAKCCVTPDSERNCFNHFAHVCGLYSACRAVDPAYENMHLLPEAPSNLAALCDESADEHTLSMCRKTCTPVECCWRNGAKECPDGTGDVCSSYSACELLNRSPPNAPLDMDEWCFGDLPEEREACENACSAGKCCIETDAGKCFNHKYVCEDYFPCALVNKAFGDMDLDGDGIPDLEIPSDNGISLNRPPNTLIKDCNFLYFESDASAKTVCENACANAACCIDDDVNANCFEEDEILCLGYFPCISVNEKFSTMIEQPYEAPKELGHDSSLSNDCQNSSTDDVARSKCEEACGGGECCVQEVGNANCYRKFEEGCKAYAPCAAVFDQFAFMAVDTGGPSVSLPVPVSNLAQICDPATLTDAEPREECAEECSAADCCFFDPDDTYYCHTTNLDECETYKPCKALQSIYLALPPADLDPRCSSGEVEDAAYCDDMCKPASDCCIADDPTINCFAENESVCLQYAPCMAIDHKYSVMYQPGGDFGDFSEEFPPLDLAKTCNELYMLQSDVSLKACQDVCDDVRCCISGNPMRNCFDQYQDVCLQYQPCSSIDPEFATLIDSQQPFVPPVRPPNTLYTMCTHNMEDENGRSACEGLCESAACCVSSHAESNCFDEYGDICTAYMACQSIFVAFSNMGSPPSDASAPPPYDALPPPSEQLKLICNQAALAVDKDPCVDLCRVAECCFPADTGAESCTDDVQCTNYAPCRNVTPYS